VIVGISGLVSSGKSYTVVKDVLTWLENDIVVTNLSLRGQGIDKYFGGWRGWRDNLYILNLGQSIVAGSRDGAPIDDDYLKNHLAENDLSECKIVGDDPWSWPRGDKRGKGKAKSFIVIDEAAEWVDAYGGVASSGWLGRFCSWLRQSAKRGQEVRLLVQHPSMLAKRVRSSIARWAWCTNMAEAKIPKLGWPYPWPFNRNITRGWWARDLVTPEGSPEMFTRDPWIYACYNTDAVSGSAINCPSVGAVHRPPPVRTFPVWLASVAVLSAFLTGLFALAFG